MSISCAILDSIVSDDIIDMKRKIMNLNNEILKLKNDATQIKLKFKPLNNKLQKIEIASIKLAKIDIIHKLYNEMYRSHIELIDEFHSKNLPKDIIINKFLELDLTIEKMNITLEKKIVPIFTKPIIVWDKVLPTNKNIICDYPPPPPRHSPPSLPNNLYDSRYSIKKKALPPTLGGILCHKYIDIIRKSRNNSPRSSQSGSGNNSPMWRESVSRNNSPRGGEIGSNSRGRSSSRGRGRGRSSRGRSSSRGKIQRHT